MLDKSPKPRCRNSSSLCFGVIFVKMYKYLFNKYLFNLNMAFCAWPDRVFWQSEKDPLVENTMPKYEKVFTMLISIPL